MDGAELELERRSKFLNSLIQKKKAIEQQEQNEHLNVKVRASDMPLALQNKAFKCARDQLDYMPGKLDSKRLALALKKVKKSNFLISHLIVLVDAVITSACRLNAMVGFIRVVDISNANLLIFYHDIDLDANPLSFQEFDSTYGPAWHCIVGTSFGSYVTHSLGGFLYFSIDKVYILLFKTAVEPLDH
ncbi:hypothetical protein Gotur_023986 [Gossypium turneri]